MEKKRRARINHYLNDLKGLLLDAMKKDPVRHSKLEKADILDLTVKHLQDIERRRLSVAMAVDPSVPEKFASGYRECIDEISKYFDSLGTVDEGLKGRVRKHLERCLTFPPKLPPEGPGGLGAGLGLGLGGFSAGLGSLPASVDDINNNGGAGLLNRALANNLSLMFPGAGAGSGGVGYPSHPTAGAGGLDLSFNPFPFFSPFQRSAPFPGYTPGTFASETDTSVGGAEALRKRTKPTVLATTPCSPPVSPTRDDRASSSPGFDVSMRTPTGKTMDPVEGTEQQQQQQQHQMERLLAIFPTPPSPEDRQRGDERFGKLGHHCDSSPFTVPSAASQQRRTLLVRPLRMNVDDDDSQEDSQEESESERAARVPVAAKDEKTTDRAGSESEEDDSLVMVVHQQGQPNRDQSGKDHEAGGGGGSGEMWRPW
ncbi:protein deadpan-like [Anopheles darlingi]|uniref:protein deadpan-like n=1 Tax=Anopheles darlingi TaxID=43151 RepID=UPI00210041BA|nr:protein deadpan-like [Anopheles darlingi]